MNSPNLNTSKFARPFLIVAGITLFIASGWAQQNGRQLYLELGQRTGVVASGDLFAGPEIDLVAAEDSATSGQILVLVNQGICSSPLVLTLSVFPDVREIQIADLDGDGDNDLVTLSPGAVSVLINQGSGTMAFARTDYSMAATPGPIPPSNKLTVGDVDGDGLLDLASERVIVPNLGGGLFGPQVELTTPASNAGFRWEWGDFDGNGAIELVAFTQSMTSNAVLSRWISTGSFSTLTLVGSTTVILPTGLGQIFYGTLTSGDFDQDGIADLLAELGPTQSTDNLVYLLTGGSNPFVGPQIQLPYMSTTFANQTLVRSEQGFDVDGNGEAEFIVSFDDQVGPPAIPAAISTHLNFGATGFVASTQSFPRIDADYTIADLNGDGALDFAVASNDERPTQIRLYLGGTTPIFDLSIVAGNAFETVVAGNGLSQAITLELRDCFGNPSPGQPLEIVEIPSGVTYSGAFPPVTDAAGQVTFDLIPSDAAADFAFEIFHDLSDTVSISIDVESSAALSFAQVPLPFVMRESERTIEVLVLDSQTLAPRPNQVVQARNIASGSPITSFTTDASGVARVVITAPIINGPQTVMITIQGNEESALSYNFYNRGLRANISSANNSLLMIYAHENFGVPLIIAADAPLPAPGFVRTSFGQVFTSVLNPQPSLSLLNGNLDPSIQTVFVRVFSIPPGLSGLSLVFQAYGVDDNYAFPDSVFISNPTFVTF